MFHPMKAETIVRKQLEYIAEQRETITDLYNRLVVAAEKNKDNPTGQDYLESAKRIMFQYPQYFI